MNLARLQSNFEPNEVHLQVSALLPGLEFLVQRAKESNLLNAVDAS